MINVDKIKNRLAFLVTEAEKRIEEAKKAGDNEIRWYYEGSLYSAKMMLLSIDCSIRVVNNQNVVIENH